MTMARPMLPDNTCAVLIQVSLLLFCYTLSNYLFAAIAILNHFDGDSCDPSQYTSTDTFYLGCDPLVNTTDYSGATTTFSVNLQCIVEGYNSTSGRRLAALTIDDLSQSGLLPSNGKNYAVQE